MITAPVRNEPVDAPTNRIKPDSAADSWTGSAAGATAPAAGADVAVFDVVTAAQKVLPQLPKELDKPLPREPGRLRPHRISARITRLTTPRFRGKSIASTLTCVRPESN